VSELLALGISHKTAPVALRERLALTQTESEQVLKDLVATDAVREAVAISTCNRTELYCVVGDPVAAETDVLGTLARRAGIRPTELASLVYSPRNCDAARQLFRVTSGLESMIVGENEVQGQVKRSYESALANGTTGPMTNRLFTAALQTGKRVRTETAISQSRVSVSSVAVDLAVDMLGDLSDKHVVIIGAGETSELTAQALAAQGVTTIFVANRHADRARSMAERFHGTVVSLDLLPEQLADADIVVSSTSSPHAIVGSEELAVVMRERTDRPLLLIDIAVPRDVDPACGEIPGVTLVDIDGLSAVVARNLQVRQGEAVGAEHIVEEEIQHFARWLGSLEVVPTITALRRRGNDIVERVLAENAGRWETASPRDLARIEAVAQAVASRLLHEPTIRMKSLNQGESHRRLGILRELFGLEEEHASEAGRDSAPPAHPPVPAPAPAAAADNVRQIRRSR
jgi:glutamyl-tRNA reductase